MDTLILTDISEGMVEKSKESIGILPNIQYKVLNAEHTEFESESMDYIIANHMLYHVPDLEKTLLEIRRILKPKGKLYATTFGENGIIKSVQRVDYIDSLRITNEYDLMDYIYSMSGFIDDDNCLKDDILLKLQHIKKMSGGVIEIKKEAGIFIAEK